MVIPSPAAQKKLSKRKDTDIKKDIGEFLKHATDRRKNLESRRLG